LIEHRGVSPQEDPEIRFVYGGKQNLYESTQVFWSVENSDKQLRHIIWDERFGNWYEEAIAERQVFWEDQYGAETVASTLERFKAADKEIYERTMKEHEERISELAIRMGVPRCA